VGRPRAASQLVGNVSTGDGVRQWVAAMTDPDTTARLAATFGNAASTYDTAIPYFSTFGRWLVDVARCAVAWLPR
jgi:hypothetical protein